MTARMGSRARGFNNWVRRAMGVAIVSAAPSLVACDRSSTEPIVGTTSSAQLSRAVAAALSDPALRQQLLTEMRVSPYTKHRVPFQQFLASQRGRPFADAIARRLGASASTVQASLANQPALEIFAPNEADRETWTGGDDIVVAAGLQVDEVPDAAFDVRGDRRSTIGLFHSSEERASGYPASIIIRPSRSLNFRFDREVTAASQTIQRIGESRLGGSLTMFGDAGDSTTEPLRGAGSFYSRYGAGQSGARASYSSIDNCDGDASLVDSRRVKPAGSSVGAVANSTQPLSVEGEECFAYSAEQGGGGSMPAIKLGRLSILDLGDNIRDRQLEFLWDSYLVRKTDGADIAHARVGLTMPSVSESLVRAVLLPDRVPNWVYDIVVIVKEDDGGWGINVIGEVRVTTEENSSQKPLDIMWSMGRSRCDFNADRLYPGLPIYKCTGTSAHPQEIWWKQLNFNVYW